MHWHNTEWLAAAWLSVKATVLKMVRPLGVTKAVSAAQARRRPVAAWAANQRPWLKKSESASNSGGQESAFIGVQVRRSGPRRPVFRAKALTPPPGSAASHGGSSCRNIIVWSWWWSWPGRNYDASAHVATLSASLSAADSESRAAGRPPAGPGLCHWHESPAPLKPQSLISWFWVTY